MKESRKLQAIFFNGTFLLLGVIAVILYKERLFMDAAYYAFYLINDGFFHVEHGRAVLAVGQFIPFLGYLIGLPLRELLVLTSLSHEIVFYALFLLLFYGLKDSAASYLLLFVHLIGQLWMYYSPMYEITYGAAFAVLFYAILRSEKVKDDKWLILMLVAQWLAMSSHPENFLLVLFVLIFDFLEKGWRKHIHSISIVVFVLGAIMEVLTFSDYERSNVGFALHNNASIYNLLDGHYLKLLSKFFLFHFPELILFSLVALLYFLFKKRFLKFGLLFTSLLIIMLAVNMKSYTVVFMRYFESMYNPLVFLASFGIVYGVYNKMKGSRRVWISVVFSLIILVRIYWIWDFGKPMRERVSQLERIVDYLQQVDHSKFVMEVNNFERSYSEYNWANPIECLLYSAIDGKNKSISLPSKIDMEYGYNRKKSTPNNFILRRFELKPNSFLNPAYFKLPNQWYEEINNADYTISPEEMKSKIHISPIEQDIIVKAGDTTNLLIKITNDNAAPLPSKENTHTFLSYHWYKDDKVMDWDGIRTPLEVDVSRPYTQDIRLAVPAKPGNYELQPDIVIEGKMWFELPEKFSVKVKR